VFVCNFSGWAEAFPTWTKKSRELAKCLLKAIIPQFGIPVAIGLHNGPAFEVEMVQLMAKGLGITWKLHATYCPQSSGKVEHMNRILKLGFYFIVRKTMSEDLSAVGSITAHSITKD
jgi:transposase InsO family protein